MTKLSLLIAILLIFTDCFTSIAIAKTKDALFKKTGLLFLT